MMNVDITAIREACGVRTISTNTQNTKIYMKSRGRDCM